MLLHLTQKVVSGVLPRGDLNIGTVQPGVGQGWSVKTWRKGCFSSKILQSKCTVMYPSFEHIITQGLRYIGDGGHVVIFVRERDEVPTSGDRNWDEIYASNHVDYVHR